MGSESSGGTQFVYGTATNAAVFVARSRRMSRFASGTVVSGGVLVVGPGGTAINATIDSGGTAGGHQSGACAC